jgi:RNA polymerase sigma-70 factor, ECF subfamily
MRRRSVPAEPTESELVGRVLGGDPDAFAALVQLHQARLRRFLTTMTGDATRAEDLIQDTFVAAFRKLPQLADPAKFASWLLAIACNHCRQHLRSEVLRAHAGDKALTEVAEERRSALSSLVRREDAALLALAIERLPILLREAFVLFAVEGCSYAEIAAATDVAEGTLQVRVHRAKALLRQQLGTRADTWWPRDPPPK